MIGIDNLKMLVVAADAKTGPPLGPVLAPYYVNLVQFCKEFNALTQHFETGVEIVLKVVVAYKRSYKMVIGMPQLTLLARSFKYVSTFRRNIIDLSSFWYMIFYILKYKISQKFSMLGTVKMLFSFLLTFKVDWFIFSTENFFYEIIE